MSIKFTHTVSHFFFSPAKKLKWIPPPISSLSLNSFFSWKPDFVNPICPVFICLVIQSKMPYSWGPVLLNCWRTRSFTLPATKPNPTTPVISPPTHQCHPLTERSKTYFGFYKSPSHSWLWWILLELPLLLQLNPLEQRGPSLNWIRGHNQGMNLYQGMTPNSFAQTQRQKLFSSKYYIN